MLPSGTWDGQEMWKSRSVTPSGVVAPRGAEPPPVHPEARRTAMAAANSTGPRADLRMSYQSIVTVPHLRLGSAKVGQIGRFSGVGWPIAMRAGVSPPRP